MTITRPRTSARSRRSVASTAQETPMTDHFREDHALTPAIRVTAVSDISTKGTTMHLLHEDLARAQIRERVESTRDARRAAQLVRARRLSRKAQKVAMQARLVRARFV